MAIEGRKSKDRVKQAARDSGVLVDEERGGWMDFTRMGASN